MQANWISEEDKVNVIITMMMMMMMNTVVLI